MFWNVGLVPGHDYSHLFLLAKAVCPYLRLRQRNVENLMLLVDLTPIQETAVCISSFRSVRYNTNQLTVLYHGLNASILHVVITEARIADLILVPAERCSAS